MKLNGEFGIEDGSLMDEMNIQVGGCEGIGNDKSFRVKLKKAPKLN